MKLLRKWRITIPKLNVIWGTEINNIIFGSATPPDGSKYVGEWKDGKKHGQGTFSWPGGAKYVGEFKDDKQHGQGTLTFDDGKVLKCTWVNGEAVEWVKPT